MAKTMGYDETEAALLQFYEECWQTYADAVLRDAAEMIRKKTMHAVMSVECNPLDLTGAVLDRRAREAFFDQLGASL